MAGYSKGIVDTRKLNKDSKAKLGRKGDTKIRKVDNRESHVNALEAYLIDVNGKAGEDYAKRVGAGTVNPLTGMPQYHPPDPGGTHDDETGHTQHQVTTTTGPHGDPVEETIWTQPLYTTAEVKTNVELLESGYEYQARDYEGEQSYDDLTKMTDVEMGGYLKKEFGLSGDYMQYISDFETKPFDFLQTEKDITMGTVEGIKEIGHREARDTWKDQQTDFLDTMKDTKWDLQHTKADTQWGLKATKADTQWGLASGYADIKGELASQQGALGRGTGRGIRQARGARDIAASKGGFAGGITQGFDTQQKDLLQDYSAGTGDISRRRTSATRDYQRGMFTSGRDYDRGMFTSGRDYDKGYGRVERDYLKSIGRGSRDFYQEMGDVTSAYDLAAAGATLDFDRGTYGEERRQVEGFYDDVGVAKTQQG